MAATSLISNLNTPLATQNYSQGVIYTTTAIANNMAMNYIVSGGGVCTDKHTRGPYKKGKYNLNVDISNRPSGVNKITGQTLIGKMKMVKYIIDEIEKLESGATIKIEIIKEQ
jgi:hypothetical protein